MADNTSTPTPNAGMPTYGMVMIDEKPATAVRFEKSDKDGQAIYDLSFRLNGKQVVRIKGADELTLTDAVGERNAARIIGAATGKGSLSGEELAFDYGLTPAENERRMLAKEDRKRGDLGDDSGSPQTAKPAGLGQAYADGMAAQHPALKDLDAEPNTIAEVKDRQLGEIDMVEALKTAAKLRQRDREEYERNAGISGVELDLGTMQRRAESERQNVKNLDSEAQRLARADNLDQRAGLTAQPERQVSVEDEKNRRIQLMEQVNAQFRVSGARHYFKDQPDRIAFRDVGDKLKSASNDQRVQEAMVTMAEAKGWKTIHTTGHPDFRQGIWLKASQRGIVVTGYKPTERDLEALAVAQERAMGNTVERGRERAQDAQRTDRAAVLPLAAEKTPGEPQQAAKGADAAKEPAPAVRTLNVHEGIMLSHGPAPYQNDPAEKLSYFVKLRGEAGEKTVWGKDLERAVGASKLSAGDAVRLEFKGSQPVTVEALKRDDKGKVIGSETIESNRNTWEAHKSDRAVVIAAIAQTVMGGKVKDPAQRERVMAEVDRQIQSRSVSGKLPAVMMYDKAAPQKVPDRERTAPVVERNAERSR
ncbi:LPD7 domain-containing protein [Xanthomonas hortorum]|uniref:LPD7 domain-containing protein n=1 Tax=Xanthomonas hortorum TaxID=56454 RepID=UPI0032E89728